MPVYLRDVEVDWGWPGLSDAERAIVRRHEARASAEPGMHTLTTLREALARASRELAGRAIRARAADLSGEYALVARDGRCGTATAADVFARAGRFPGPLTIDDFHAAGVERLHVGLCWPERLLRATQAQAARLDRSVSWIVQRACAVAPAVTAPPRREIGVPPDREQRRLAVYLPLDLYATLADEAAREERSLSFVVQRAVATAWPVITAMAPGSRG